MSGMEPKHHIYLGMASNINRFYPVDTVVYSMVYILYKPFETAGTWIVVSVGRCRVLDHFGLQTI